MAGNVRCTYNFSLESWTFLHNFILIQTSEPIHPPTIDTVQRNGSHLQWFACMFSFLQHISWAILVSHPVTPTGVEKHSQQQRHILMTGYENVDPGANQSAAVRERQENERKPARDWKLGQGGTPKVINIRLAWAIEWVNDGRLDPETLITLRIQLNGITWEILRFWDSTMMAVFFMSCPLSLCVSLFGGSNWNW